MNWLLWLFVARLGRFAGRVWLWLEWLLSPISAGATLQSNQSGAQPDQAKQRMTEPTTAPPPGEKGGG
eukprot:4803244-Pyramimonas_sp.AAC.1